MNNLGRLHLPLLAKKPSARACERPESSREARFQSFSWRAMSYGFFLTTLLMILSMSSRMLEK